jgi:hypothetical protein
VPTWLSIGNPKHIVYRGLTIVFQPRRLMIAPAADGCKRCPDERGSVTTAH